MSRVSSQSKLLPIWGGWRHLFEPFHNLEAESLRHCRLVRERLEDWQSDWLQRLISINPQLFCVDANVLTLSRLDLDKFIHALRGLAPVGQVFRYQRRFLEIIDAGNRTGRFSIPIPYLPAPLPLSDPSPFDSERIVLKRQLEELISDFVCSLRDGTEALTANQWWGRTLLSAMLFGGLLRSEWLLALPDALTTAEDELRWLDLPLQRLEIADEGSVKAQPIRRWLPDPVTRLMLIQGVKCGLPEISSSGTSRDGLVTRLIRDYARRSNFEDKIFRVLSEFRAAIATRLHQSLPPYLVYYLTGRYASTSLPPQAWKHLIDAQQRVLSELRPGKNGRHQHIGRISRDDTNGVNSGPEGWPIQLRELAIRVRKDDRKAFSRWLDSDGSALLPTVRLLATWIDGWLYRKGRGRLPKRMRTVYGMLNSIGGRLVGQLGDFDILANMQASVFIEIYTNALDDAQSLSVRRRVAHALKSFHEYLVYRYDAPPLGQSGLFTAFGKKGATVDANLLSVHSFFLALNWLDKHCLETENAEIANALCRIAGLGFFAGLRRSEVIGLELHDLEVCRNLKGEIAHVDLIVRPNGLRNLKTRASQRVIPLSDLMPKEELKRLIAWLDKRLDEENQRLAAGAKSSSRSLFYLAGSTHRLRDTDPLLEKITEALQRASGDPTIRFHHLRHSFATWQVVKFWQTEQPRDDAWPGWLDRTVHRQRRDERAVDERTAILGRNLTNRRSLLQVSALLGHASPDITLASYVHLLDVLAARSLLRITPNLRPKELQRLSGYSAPHVRRKRKEARPQGENGGLRGLRENDNIVEAAARGGKHHRPLPDPVKPVDFSTPPPKRYSQAPFDRLRMAADILNESRAAGTRCVSEEIAERYDLPLEKVEKLIVRLEVIQNQSILRFIGSGASSAHSSVIQIPRGPKARDLAERTLDTLQRIVNVAPKSQNTERKLLRVIEILIHGWDGKSGMGVKLWKLPEAKSWIWLVDELGLSEGLVGYHLASSKPSARPLEEQRRYWARKLNLELDTGLSRNVKEHPDPPKGIGARGGVVVSIDVRRIADDKLPYNKVTVLDGVRFVLVMWWISRGLKLVLKPSR